MKVLLLLIPMIVLAILIDTTVGRAAGTADVAHAFPYPIDGWEYVVAIVAIGLLASRYDDRQIWVVPVSFVLAFAAGLSLGMLDTASLLQPVEILVLVSTAVSVVLVFTGRCLRLSFAVPLFAGFALLQGYAHGIQITSETPAVRYSREVVSAVAILLLIGVSFGAGVRLFQRRWGAPAPIGARDTPA